MLVYLDSAQFAWLELASAEERGAFLEVWQASGHDLAISLHHLHEMGQLDTPDNVRARAQILGRFPRIRAAQPSTVVERFEIKVQLAQALGRASPGPEQMRRMLFPPASSHDVGDAAVEGHQIFRTMKTAYGLSAEAEALSKEAASASSVLTLKFVDHVRSWR